MLEPYRGRVYDPCGGSPARIADTYHAWRSEGNAKPQGHEGAKKRESLGGSASSRLCGYSDVPGFRKSAPLEEVRKHGHVLTLGRCVGAEAVEDDGEPFEETMKCLTATLYQHQAEGAKLDAAIAANLKELRYGG